MPDSKLNEKHSQRDYTGRPLRDRKADEFFSTLIEKPSCPQEVSYAW